VTPYAPPRPWAAAGAPTQPVAAGIIDAFANRGEPSMNKRVMSGALALVAGVWLAGAAAAQATTGADAAAAAAKEPGAVVTASGLVYRALAEGKGASPAATDVVKVHYRGTLPEGTEFDSSYKRGQPAEFPLNRVIACWTEGLQKMKVGGKARLTCPPAIAYGPRGAGGVIPPNATLHFEVELLGINGR
jgi:FKBP-type peptidyl-prolyl cis-trans isomerase FkpA